MGDFAAVIAYLADRRALGARPDTCQMSTTRALGMTMLTFPHRYAS